LKTADRKVMQVRVLSPPPFSSKSNSQEFSDAQLPSDFPRTHRLKCDQKKARQTFVADARPS
jgi:hypothetical protein